MHRRAERGSKPVRWRFLVQGLPSTAWLEQMRADEAYSTVCSPRGSTGDIVGMRMKNGGSGEGEVDEAKYIYLYRPIKMISKNRVYVLKPK